MTRKNMRGIIGKAEPTLMRRPQIGAGIGFKELNLKTGADIKKASKKYNLNMKETNDF
ncbi:hypothetical protein GGQ84_003074 [Desulfitispora alkaliphila]|uniref:hypothetical protein n=1 Tax=Desulfitispora alkaliphila TaxID=622674 RepID=UPI003D1D6589